MNHHPIQEASLDDSLKAAPSRDALYVFTCHVAWRNEGNLAAFQELIAALDDPDEEIRLLAESLLLRAGHQLLTSRDRHYADSKSKSL